jgi:hypothetical protein
MRVIRPCDGHTQVIHSGDRCHDCGETWAECCCPKVSEQVCEEDCGKILVTNLAICTESQLNANKCTYIVETAIDNKAECGYTPKSIILAAYNVVNTSSICDDIPENYLEFYNDAVREINAKIDTLWQLNSAIVKTCGRCEFYAPRKYVSIVSVTDDVMNCNNGCNKRKYKFISGELWDASTVLGGWTFKGKNIIVIKDPLTCGSNCGIPSFLKVTYYKQLDLATSLDECLSIEDDAVNVIRDLIIMNSLGVKFNNKLAISRSLDRYQEFFKIYKSRDDKKVDNPPYKVIYPAFRIRG